MSFDASKYSLPSEVKIGNKLVGQGNPCFVVAEIGNNHNGSYELAQKSIQAAAFAGADAVKLQKRTVEEVFTKELRQVPQTSQKFFGATYEEYRRRLELTDHEISLLKEYAHSLGLIFFVTPFDLKSAEALAEIGMDCWKIASFDLNHPALLDWLAKKNQPIILSTGMSSLEERDAAINTILATNQNLIINHCVSIYPTPPQDYNLGAIHTMRNRYAPLPVGYSGHEIGYVATVAAVAIGATTIERHFTTDKALPGPDHATVSLEPIEFADMVKNIRIIEKAVADTSIYLHEKEVGHRNKHGKSIATRVPIKAGTQITQEMLCFKSPGNGIKPTLIDMVVGKKARMNISEDTVITEDYLVL
jgi:sialic acid synthase SpsE